MNNLSPDNRPPTATVGETDGARPPISFAESASGREVGTKLRGNGQESSNLPSQAISYGKRLLSTAALSLLGTALDVAANGVVITDPRGNVVWSNPAFTMLTGYEPAEILGRNMRVLKSGLHDNNFYKGLWRTILEGGVWRAEVINLDKSRNYFVQEQTITPLRDQSGAISHFVSIQQDITANWRVQAALRESEERLKSLSDAAFEGIIIHERGQILEVNQVLAKTFGYGPLELIARPILDLFEPESHALAQMNLLSAVGHPYEAFGRRKDGGRIDLQVRNRPIFYRGRMAGVTAINDITRSKRDRERIKSLEHQKAVEMERARVARDMHDELGGILTRIKLLSERLERDARGSEKVVQHAELISRTSRELAQRMDEIVWAVDPQKDKLEDLGSYLVAYAQEFLDLANLRCRFHLPEILPELSLSAPVRYCLFLVVKEALTNVVRHARATEVQIGLKVQDNLLELHVKDNGTGFDATRIHSKRNGLNNLRKRLSELGGECWIESELNQGTTVRIALLCSKAVDTGCLAAINPPPG